MVGGCCRDGNREQDIAESHHEQTLLYGPFVVLAAVGYDTSDQRKHIDCCIENRVDNTCGTIADTKLGAEEEQKDGVHYVVAESLAHIAQCGCKQPFGMSFEHILNFK